MKTMHAVTGLPRSGSTVLCALLSQLDVHVSSTSNLPGVLEGISTFLSNQPETKARLATEQLGTEDRIRRSLRAYVDAWYEPHTTVIDKSRGWSANVLTFHDLFPDGRLIVTVRDLRGVFGSVEKHHQRFPVLDIIGKKTLYERADMMFGPDGMIGSCVVGIEDLLRRDVDYVKYVRFEDFMRRPEETAISVADFLGLSDTGFDLTNIPDYSNELDALYLYKYPHKVHETIVPPQADEWKDYVSPDVATLIMDKFNGYNKAFGYF